MVAVQLRPEPALLELPHPYLLFLGDVREPSYAKTAFGLKDWAPEKCVGEIALPSGTISVGLPRLTPAEARARGARALVIGVANPGGVIGRGWVQLLLEACRPPIKSRPASSASSSSWTQPRPITPPGLATPITRARAPRARASAGVSRGSPTLTVPDGKAISPTHFSGAQSFRPKAVLA